MKPCTPDFSNIVDLTSTNLKSMSYDKICEQLQVTFKDDTVYIYSKVPLAKFGLLKRINKKKAKDPNSTDEKKSVGKYFNKEIEEVYDGKKQ